MFSFKDDYILENERALLVPLKKESDIIHLLPYSLKEPDLWKYSLQSAAGKENMEKYIRMALEKREMEDSYPFLIHDKTTKQVAGSTRFYDYQAHHKTVQLGYTWLGRSFQGTGLNRFCKSLMLNFAFDKMEIERVEFRADATNAKSISAMKAIGCEEEGILRSNCASPDGRRDSIILSILRSEWYASKKEALEQKCYLK